MLINEMHFAFKLNVDNIDSLSNQNFRPEEIDWLLNEAQDIFISTRFTTSNSKRVGFENTTQRIDDLSTLVVKYPLQPAIIPTLDSGVYEVDLDDLLFGYLHLLNGKCTVISNACSSTVPLRFTQNDDLLESLRDPFNNPSLEFLPYNMGRNSNNHTSIFIYPGDLEVTEVFLEYLKKPSKLSLGSYVYIDGTTYPKTDCELPENVHGQLVDIAAQIASLSIENPEYLKLKSQKVFINN